MKKLLFLGAICALGISAKAQNVTNTTTCDIIIRQICVTTSPCIKNYSGNTMFVPAGASLPNSMPPCAPGEETVYEVLWAMCGSGVVLNGTPPPTVCPPAPYASPMPACAACMPIPATASFNPMTGDIDIF